MTDGTTGTAAGRRAADHLLGRFRGSAAGPLLVCIGGIHGNEPAGVAALERVVASLTRERPPFRGELVALRGNLAALELGRRFVDEDLNRIWTLPRIGSLRENGVVESPEVIEQAELLALLDDLFSEADGTVHVVDLHTTSSESAPFLTFSDTLRNRGFAAEFPVPFVLGLEEELEGTLLDYVNHLGYVAVGVEGGSHRDPESVDNLEAAVWLSLVAAGNMEPERVPELRSYRRRLRRAGADLPDIFEVRYRHALRGGEGFRMDPGYRNFEPVRRGQAIARDGRGRIRAQESGRLFLPLYQTQGDEGFFLVRPVAPFWLTVSAWLRRLRVDELVRWVPGIRRHPERPETLIVDPRLARPLVVNLFHLLGFRRERPENGSLVFSRRKDAVEQP